MTPLTLAIAAVALGDLVAGGLAGVPRSLRSAVAGTAATGAVLAAGTAATAGGMPGAWMAALGVFAAGAAWLMLRVLGTRSERRRRWRDWGALAALGCGLGLGIVPAFATAAVASSPSTAWHSLPLAISTDRLLLTGAILLFLTSTSNGVVRLTLGLAGSQLARSEQRLRGGRFIGVLERWLIFGLALAGEPAAAALIASAKSLLRFPELTMLSRASSGENAPAEAGPEINAVTEYLLLGSLTSWLLALVWVPVWLAV